MFRTWSYDPGLDPALIWAGKAERSEVAVPVLPLFEHEVVDSREVVGAGTTFRHGSSWRNRLIHGDSLIAMAALVEYDGLGEQVQTVFMDPPYGVKYASNFQPFVRSRAVRHDDARDLVREPEVIQAYRDTWELGVHSYLTYMRDRLGAARELLAPTGACFVQIGDDNVHRVRLLLDEVFGAEAFIAQIPFRKKTMPLGARFLDAMCDHLLWYAKDPERMTYRQLYQPLQADFHWKVDPSGRRYRYVSMKAPGYSAAHDFAFDFEGALYRPPPGGSWITTAEGMSRLCEAGRLAVEGRTLVYTLYWDDFPLAKLTNLWHDTVGAHDKRYVVQTSEEVVTRCLLMTSDPGDLVVDPTCGSGTTPLVAERWGRRWIAIDTARVPIALTRERLLAATHPVFRLHHPERGPAGGFCYRELDRVNLRTLANGEPPETITLFDQPEVVKGQQRLSGPFELAATGPAPVAVPAAAAAAVPSRDRTGAGSVATAGSVAMADAGAGRLLEFLRRAPVIRLPGGRELALSGLRELTAEWLHAAAECGGRTLGISFGPIHGSVTDRQVGEAAATARKADYDGAFVIGMAFSPGATQRAAAEGVTLVHATADLALGDLLRTTRASEIFAVTGSPEFDLEPAGAGQYQVRLGGVDVFDPVELAVRRLEAADVPAWFLDTDFDGRVFRVRQAQFPRTRAFEALRRTLGDGWDESWGRRTVSEPFPAGEHRQIAVKVVDDRGHELVATRALPPAMRSRGTRRASARA